MLNSIEQVQAFAFLLREGGAAAWREFFVIFDVAFLHSAANAAKKRCCASRHCWWEIFTWAFSPMT
jgi:hypothetical protein